MEINKQLFEDVLSGKLKGTFVLKNGFTVRSNRLFYTGHNYYSYALKGFSCSFSCEGNTPSIGYDIIDFIPNTNMKEKELTIEIPDNKIVDWDESKKQNKIVLKDKQLTYKEICEKIFSTNNFYYINENGRIVKSGTGTSPFLSDANNAITEHQLECILAKNQLANVAKYLNSLSSETAAKYYIYDGYVLNVQQLLEPKFNLGLVMFKSKELAQQAIEILGEETVKLALEPLGI